MLMWLAMWSSALLWAGVRDPAGLLIPIVASAALPRIFRQLHPAPLRTEPPPRWSRSLGHLALAVGVALSLAGMLIEPPPLDPLTRQVAVEEVEAFLADREAEHGAPLTEADWEATKVALNNFTADRSRERKLEHERSVAQRQAARPLGMFGGAALAILGLVLASERRQRRPQRQGVATAAVLKRRRSQRRGLSERA